MTEEMFNARLCALPPKEGVLFLFNEASGKNFSLNDVDVGLPTFRLADGTTDVSITGLNYRGLSGVGPIEGISNFTYQRKILNEINVGEGFFYTMQDDPNFLGAVDEFARVTGINCSSADFVEQSFVADSDGNRWLEADPLSWRFIGRVNLGRPFRAPVSIEIPNNVVASLSGYDGCFWNDYGRAGADFNISHMASDYNRYQVGMRLDRPNDTLMRALLEHLLRKGIDATWTVGTSPRINLYNAEVVYKGALRPGDTPPLPSLDRVLAFKPVPRVGKWATGEIKLWFSSTSGRTVVTNPGTVVSLNLTQPRLTTAPGASLLPAVVVGTRVRTIGSIRELTELFQAVFGIEYSDEIYGDMIVTFNGPHRPIDQLPIGVTEANVLVIQHAGEPTSAVAAPFKIYY